MDAYGNIASAINDLIAMKSKRDNSTFTTYQLAKAININRSVIHRIMTGQIRSPGIETLTKIIRFFVNDGFQLTLDDLLNWKNQTVDVQSMEVSLLRQLVTLPLFEMSALAGVPMGKVNIMMHNNCPGMIAMVSKVSQEPIFKAGSIFIVHLNKEPKNENIVAVRYGSEQSVSIMRYEMKGDGKEWLVPFAFQEDAIGYCADSGYILIGTVVHIEIKI